MWDSQGAGTLSMASKGPRPEGYVEGGEDRWGQEDPRSWGRSSSCGFGAKPLPHAACLRPACQASSAGHLSELASLQAP